MHAVVVNNLSKKFRIPHQKRTTTFQMGLGLLKGKKTYEEFWAEKDVSFNVEPGETFGIIGRNGSGKSTMLKILSRVIYPDSGTMSINGKVASFLELGVGFQPELTAAENVNIYGAILGMSRKRIKEVYEDIFTFAELKKFEDMKLKNFSSGMYLRLSFSTAIMAMPDIVLIDEVLAVGDIAFQRKCFQKIHEFQEQGKTIVIVTHDLDSVREICSRTLLMESGQAVAIGPTEEVLERYLEAVK